MRKEISIGTKVHYDSDNKEWGERIVGDGEILEKRKEGRYLVHSYTHRANILFFRRELSVKK